MMLHAGESSWLLRELIRLSGPTSTTSKVPSEIVQLMAVFHLKTAQDAIGLILSIPECLLTDLTKAPFFAKPTGTDERNQSYDHVIVIIESLDDALTRFFLCSSALL